MEVGLKIFMHQSRREIKRQHLANVHGSSHGRYVFHQQDQHSPQLGCRDRTESVSKFVCPDSPYPPRDGGSLRIINLARSLASHASVMLLTYVVSPDEVTALTQLEHIHGIQVRSVQRPARRNTLTRAWHKLRYYYGSYLFTSLPGPVRFNSQPVMHEALRPSLAGLRA